MNAEKSDVAIEKLFAWGKEFKITNKNEIDLATVYIRLVGDADINRSRVFALRKSAELRRKLNDVNSDESLAFIPEVESFDKERLVEVTIVYSMRDFVKEASEIDVPLPKEPRSDDSLEKHEKYQAEVDAYPAKRDTAYQKNLDKIIERERKHFSTMETLHKGERLVVRLLRYCLDQNKI